MPRNHTFDCKVCSRTFRTMAGLRLHQTKMRHAPLDIPKAAAPVGPTPIGNRDMAKALVAVSTTSALHDTLRKLQEDIQHLERMCAIVEDELSERGGLAE